MSCIGVTRASIDELLALYRSHGIRRLVAFIRERTGTWFHTEVAA